MAFTEFENKDPKIQCPISREAHSILVNDNLAFVLDDYRDDEDPVKPGRSGDGPSTSFLNRILYNFYPEAQASIGRRLDEYQEELEHTLGKLSLTKKGKELIRTFKNEKEQRLVDYGKNLKPTKMEKLEPRLQFNLNVSERKGGFYKYITGRKLEGDSLECKEDQYYKGQNQYITALLEEYAHLPFIERERIFFKGRFKRIKEAIKKHCLKITFYTGNGNKKVHIVQPYAIKTDPKQTTSYIVGYSYEENEENEENNEQSELRPCCFNIVNIAHCASCTDQKYSLTDKQIADLVDIIDKYGVQFIAGDKLTIQARFTKEGFRKYKRIPILRPLPKLNKNEKFEDKTPEDIIQFECSEYQAKNYFLRLGEDVIILSPQNLREYFSKIYHTAANLYDNE